MFDFSKMLLFVNGRKNIEEYFIEMFNVSYEKKNFYELFPDVFENYLHFSILTSRMNQL